MDILEKIIARKYEEVAERQEMVGIGSFLQEDFFNRVPTSLKASLLAEGSSGIIAEFKRKSPSKGDINKDASVYKVTQAYKEAGAAGISVLTDVDFFGGALKDLFEAKNWCPLPILRKDFMVDRYQLFEAKAYGADVILLIAAALSKQKIHELAKVAKELQLEILFEIHDESELDKLSPLVDMVGVNNRNLKDFTVDYNRSLTLVDKIPSEFVKVSESGISDPATIGILRAAGYQGFLIGENFMRTTDPGQAAMEFIQQSSKA